MNRGYALLEVLMALLVIATAVDLILTALIDFPQREISVQSSPWNLLNEGCDYACVFAADSP
ncbi:MAG: prepilin-type N-terminal cleavage/methylation domain-containing protein [Erysipelotrichaceae bacterium]